MAKLEKLISSDMIKSLIMPSVTIEIPMPQGAAPPAPPQQPQPQQPASNTK